MSIELFLYLTHFFGTLHDITDVYIILFSIISLFSLLFFGIVHIASESEYQLKKFNILFNSFKKNFNPFLIIFLFALFLNIMLPNEKTLYLMLGAHYLKKSDIPSKIAMVLDKKLDEYLATEPKKEKG